METFFDFRENRYNIREFQEMRQQKVRTVRYGLETALYRAPQLWSLVPADLKSLPNVNHETIIREGITCKKILLQKSIEFGINLK